jgi:hypothetical protein
MVRKARLMGLLQTSKWLPARLMIPFQLPTRSNIAGEDKARRWSTKNLVDWQGKRNRKTRTKDAAAASVVVNRASYFSSALKNPKKHTRPPLSCVDIVGENVVTRERKAPNPSTRRLRRNPVPGKQLELEGLTRKSWSSNPRALL